MARAGVNALSDRKRVISGSTPRLDTALLRTYTLPFALDDGNSGYQDYQEGNH
jgi:hypothetical protein